MVTVVLSEEYARLIVTAVEAYTRNLARYINKSADDMMQIEKYQVLRDTIKDAMLDN